MTHRETVIELIDRNSIMIGDAFDYNGHDLEKIFDLYFQFAQTNLDRNDNAVDIEPARVYFRNQESVNARAGLSSGIYVIGVNKGTIEKLYDFFINLDPIFDNDDLKEYKALDNYLPESLVYLMYQLCTAFTFYHEKAHLLQKSADVNSFDEEYEFNAVNDAYSQLHHVLELDADLYAAHFCTMHILGYWDVLPSDGRTAKALILLSSCAVASIFSYWLFLLKDNNDIYYRASNHPHPVIRIAYLVTTIADTLKAHIEESIDVKEVVRNSILLSERFFLNKGENKVQGYVQIFQQESNSIENYIQELLAAAERQPNLTMHFNL